MKNLLLLLLIGCSVHSFAQSISGLVVFQADERKPVAGAEVVVHAGSHALELRTDEQGAFTADLTAQPSLEYVRIEIKRPGLVVVDQDELWVNVAKGANPQLVIRMEDPDVYRQRLTRYAVQAMKLLADARSRESGSEAAGELQRAEAVAHRQLGSLLEQLAAFDRGQASAMARQALQQFEDGNMEEALASLDDESMKAALEAARPNASRGAAEPPAGSPAAWQQSLDNYLIKARLHVLNLQPEKANSYYARALYEDQQDLEKLLEVSRFLGAWGETSKALALSKKGLSLAINKAETLALASLQANLQVQQEIDEQTVDLLETVYAAYGKLEGELPSHYLDELATSLDHLSKVYNRQGAYEQAIEVQEGVQGMVQEKFQLLPEVYHLRMGAVLSTLGHLHALRGEYTQARAHLQQSMSWLRKKHESGPDALRAYRNSQLDLAEAYLQFGHHDSAYQAFSLLISEIEQAPQEGALEAIDRHALRKAVLGRVQAHMERHELQAALSSLKPLVEGLRKAEGHGLMLARALSLQARCQVETLAFEQAEATYNELGKLLGSLQQAGTLQDQALLGQAYEDMGSMYLVMGEADRAEKALTLAQTIWEAPEAGMLDVRLEQYENLQLRHELAASTRDAGTSADLYEQLQAQWQASQQPLPYRMKAAWAAACLQQADLARWQKKGPEAAAALDQVAAVAATLPENQLWNARAQEIRARMQLEQGKMEEARALAQAAINELGHLEQRKAQLSQWPLFHAYLTYALALSEQLQFSSTRAQLTRAEAIMDAFRQASTLPMVQERARMHAVWGQYYLKREDFVKGEERLLQARDLLESDEASGSIEAQRVLANLYYQLAFLYHDTDRFDASMQAFRKAEAINASAAVTFGAFKQEELADLQWKMAKHLIEWGAYEEAIASMRKVASMLEKLQEKTPIIYEERLAGLYTDLSWSSLLSGELTHAQAYMEAARTHETSDLNVKLKWAHVLLVTDEFSDAKKIYTSLYELRSEGRRIKDICQEDFDKLLKAGYPEEPISRMAKTLN